VRRFQAEIPGRMSEGSGNAAKKGNGYTYQTGKTIGYKIDNGKICLRFPNGQKGCVSVETDGKRSEMITTKGDRSDLQSRLLPQHSRTTVTSLANSYDPFGVMLFASCVLI